MSKRTLVVLAFALGACGSPRKSEPFTGELTLNESQRRGQLVFFRNCNECHPQGESGVAPSINDKRVPDFVLKNQVRNPIAFMPNFEKDSISEQQLDDLVEYLKAVRHASALSPDGG